jgi:hypothetical protein
LKDQKHKLDWRVGDPNNSDTDEESVVTDNLFVGSMFRVFGDVNSVIYRITQVNKFLLFNYHGVKTSEPRTRAHNCDDVL